MLDNTHYNKIKVLHLLSTTAWFIEKCAKIDSKEAGHMDCLREYEELQKLLDKQIEILHKSLCKACPK